MRPVLVTGAASGIGQATSERLAAEGAPVALVDCDAERLELVAAALRARGSVAVTLAADVSREDEVAAAVAHAAEALGGLRGVVTCAGVLVPEDLRPCADVEVAIFTRVLAINLTGTFLVVKHALPHLVRAGGALVTVASTAGLRGHGMGAGYTASKGGVIALTRLVALQYAAHGVRANCICPGGTRTAMTEGLFALPEVAEQAAHGIPLGRFAGPDEIAAVACFLLGDGASYLSGQAIAVDGGATVR